MVINGLPPRTHPNWNAVAAGKITRPWSTLAVKIMMARIAQDVARDPSAGSVNKCADEIYAFFKKNEAIAARDIEAIFG